MRSSFTTRLEHYIRRKNFTPREVATRADVPYRTVARWLKEGVAKPHTWMSLAQLGRVLHLSEDELSELLHLVGYPTVAELRLHVTAPKEVALLQYWAGPVEEPSPGQVRQQPLRHNLPAPTTVFVGRTQQLSELSAFFHTRETRLLTFTGMAGIGKTRLALELVARMLERFDDGVWFVPLAAISAPSFMPAQVAQSLGLREQAHLPIVTQIKEYLQARQILLVLDNFEHVLPAARWVSEWLAAAPNLKVVVTSREPLSIYGEQEYLVPPLTLLRAEQVLPPTKAMTSEAVELFVRRVRLIQSDFTLNAANVVDTIAICRQIEGWPLAIELAAAQIRHLSPPQILAQLQSAQIDVSQPLQDRPKRHYSLGAAIDWSYQLLTATEQRVLRWLAVCRGGWTLATAQAVCMDVVASPSTTEPDAAAGSYVRMANVLEDLTRKHLVRSAFMLRLANLEEEPATTRYDMAAVIQELALRQLREHGEWEQAYRDHAYHFVLWVQGVAMEFIGPRQKQRLRQVDVEQDNLRTALQWLLDNRELAGALDLAGAIGHYWFLRSHYREGVAWLRSLITKVQTEADELTATAPYGLALHRGAVLAYALGDYELARTWNLALLELAEAPGYESFAARAYHGLGNLAHIQNDYATAQQYFQQSLTLWHNLGDRHHITVLLHQLGVLAREQQDFTRATALFDEEAALQREIGNVRGLSYALNNLAMVKREQGEQDQAKALAQEALRLAQTLGDQERIYRALQSLGQIAYLAGEYRTAQKYAAEALTICEHLGDYHYLALCRYGLAVILSRQGQWAKALPLYQESLRAAVNEGNNVLALSVVVGIAQLMLESADLMQAYILATGAATLASAQNIFLEKVAQQMLEALIASTTEKLSSQEITEAQNGAFQLTIADLTAAASSARVK